MQKDWILIQWLKKHSARAYKTKATINMDAVRGFAYEYTFFSPQCKMPQEIYA